MPKFGRYAGGGHFLVNDAGGVRITGITPNYAVGTVTNPDATTQTGVKKNGAMVLKSWDGSQVTQGFTDVDGASSVQVSYTDALNVEPTKTGSAIEFTTGESGTVLKAVSLDQLVSQRVVDAIGELTVTTSEPAANSYKPGIFDFPKTSVWTTADAVDVTTLPTNALVGGEPSVAEIVNNLRWPKNPQWGSGDHDRHVAAVKNFPAGEYPARDIGRWVSYGILSMCQNISTADKNTIRDLLITIGIDAYSYLNNRTTAPDFGGQNGIGGLGGVTQRGYKQAIAFAGLALNDASMKAMAGTQAFVEDGQCAYVTQGLIDQDQSINGGFPGRIDYTLGDLGMPEWTVGNILLSPTQGDRKATATYRDVTIDYYVITALAVHLYPGMKAIFGAQPMLDYVDRCMERDFLDNPADPLSVNKWARTTSGTNGLRAWTVAVWDAYRTLVGNAAVWDWPA